jgi:hypothetical protein
MSDPKKGKGYDDANLDGSPQKDASAKGFGVPADGKKDGYENPGAGDKGARSGTKLGTGDTNKDGYDDAGIKGDMGFEGHGKKSKGY